MHTISTVIAEVSSTPIGGYKESLIPFGVQIRRITLNELLDPSSIQNYQIFIVDASHSLQEAKQINEYILKSNPQAHVIVWSTIYSTEYCESKAFQFHPSRYLGDTLDRWHLQSSIFETFSALWLNTSSLEKKHAE